MMRTLFLSLTVAWVCAGLAQDGAPASNSPAAGAPVFSAALEQQAFVTNPPPAPSPTATNGGASEDIAPALDNQHILQPADQVSFRIVEDRDPPSAPEKLLQVSDSSDIDVPYIGTVNVAKLTCQQAAAKIKHLLEKDYYYRATVILGLASAGKNIGRVYIWGEVKTQGALPLPANETLTVGKAILAAGGFGDFAKTTKVKLIRTTNGEKKIFELNMDDILKRGETEKDIPLLPDDFILVDKRAVNF
jgi:polysaccharide biosynthesis/export protein